MLEQMLQLLFLQSGITLRAALFRFVQGRMKSIRLMGNFQELAKLLEVVSMKKASMKGVIG